MRGSTSNVGGDTGARIKDPHPGSSWRYTIEAW